MNVVARKLMGVGTKAAASVYRRTRGRIGGSAKGLPVLLLSVSGRKTGKPRAVPVAFFEHDDGYLVAASGAGGKADPQWIHNLAAAGTAHVSVYEDEFDVDARVVDGPERDELWRDVVLAQAPFFSKYEKKSGRMIPLALLTKQSRQGGQEEQ